MLKAVSWAGRSSAYTEAVNVLSFGAVGNGVTDDSAAFQAAVNSVASGTGVRIVVPGGTTGSNRSYVLTTTVQNNGRIPFYELQPGASIVGGAASKLQWPSRWTEYGTTGTKREYSSQAVDASVGSASHEYVQMNRTTSKGGYGIRWGLTSSAYGAGGYDIAHAIVSIFDRTTGNDGGQGLSQWLVAVSPQVGGGTTRWGTFATEMNITNRGPDTGWSKRRSTLTTFTGIAQFVVEAQTFAAPGTATNVTYHIVLAAAAPAQSYNGILLEPNAIAAGGYGAYWSGNNAGIPANYPIAALALDDAWKTGFRTRAATFETNNALEMAASHRIAWTDASDVVLNTILSGTGTPEAVVTAPVGSMYLRRDGGVSTTLYVKTSGTGNTGWTAK